MTDAHYAKVRELTSRFFKRSQVPQASLAVQPVVVAVDTPLEVVVEVATSVSETIPEVVEQPVPVQEASVPEPPVEPEPEQVPVESVPQQEL
jgi:hypothetical protein